jgi:TonB family protein
MITFRRLANSVGALFLLASDPTGAAIQPESSPSIALGKVKDYLGKRVTVCGRVVTHGCAEKDRVTTLDLEKPYWEQNVAVLITEQARRNFPRRLEDGYVLGDICATGTVERREGRHVIRVEKPDQITIRNPPASVPFSNDAIRPCDEGGQTPVIAQGVPPRYTRAAMQALQQGRVYLEAEVNTSGTIGEIRVLHGLKPDLGLDEQAVLSVKPWRFKPGLEQGRSVPVIVTFEVSFTLK